MFEDSLYNLWIFDTGNNLYLATAFLTRFYFNGDDPLQSLRGAAIRARQRHAPGRAPHQRETRPWGTSLARAGAGGDHRPAKYRYLQLVPVKVSALQTQPHGRGTRPDRRHNPPPPESPPHLPLRRQSHTSSRSSAAASARQSARWHHRQTGRQTAADRATQKVAAGHNKLRQPQKYRARGDCATALRSR